MLPVNSKQANHIHHRPFFFDAFPVLSRRTSMSSRSGMTVGQKPKSDGKRAPLNYAAATNRQPPTSSSRTMALIDNSSETFPISNNRSQSLPRSYCMNVSTSAPASLA